MRLERRSRVRRSLRFVTIVLVAALVAIVVWLAIRERTSSSPPAPTSQRATAVAVSPAGLVTLANTTGQPIYWIGRKPGYSYELTSTADGRVYVRYLPPGVSVGADQPYLTIGTYPVAGAYTVTHALASKAGNVEVKIGGDGIAFYSPQKPTSVYFAYPGSNYQVEVYDPSPAEARQLVTKGQVAAVAPSAGTTGTTGTQTTAQNGQGARLMNLAELRAFVKTAGNPVYWAGPETGKSYELSGASGGRLFVRYLPAGASAGANAAYLTVGTYPIKDAFSITKKQAKSAGAVAIRVGGGGVAFYNRSRPTNIYLAFPGQSVQIEVFAPSPAQVRRLVTADRIVPVG